MDANYSSFARAQSRAPRTKAILGLTAAAFLLGALLVAFLMWDRDGGFSTGDLLRFKSDEETVAAPAPVAAPQPSPSATQTDSAAVARATRRVDQMEEQQGGLDQRVAAMEQRLSRLDLQAQAAAGNAARAEGLLIAFAARRAIERGAPLGYLADQLRLRFGDARPNAVQTVIDAAQNPVTLDQLLAQLEGLAPALVEAPRDEGALDWLGRELGDLFVVRREASPSPLPQRRLDRARLFLESGRIDAAIAEVRNLPNAGEAQAWVEKATRYAAAQRALELIETTAVLEPRELRDGSGNRVEQLSPAGATGSGN